MSMIDLLRRRKQEVDRELEDAVAAETRLADVQKQVADAEARLAALDPTLAKGREALAALDRQIHKSEIRAAQLDDQDYRDLAEGHRMAAVIGVLATSRDPVAMIAFLCGRGWKSTATGLYRAGGAPMSAESAFELESRELLQEMSAPICARLRLRLDTKQALGSIAELLK